MLEAPNILNSSGQAEACLPADCVIKTDCRSATVAFWCLAAGRRASAEHSLL